MADNSTMISRAQLLQGLCLSLAALIGFLLADPLRFSSFAVLGVLGAILCWPLFARWYHPLLVFSFHSAFILAFLPGNLPLWAYLAAGGFLLAVFHRSINPEVRLWSPGGVPWALLVIAGVVVLTALANGGLGFKALGSASTGSKKYVFILLGIAAYFVLVSRPVSRQWALAYIALFCLSGLTGLLAHGVYLAGGGFYWLFNIIDPSPAVGQAMAEWDVQGRTVFRSTGTVMAASAILGLLAAKYGMRDLLDLKRPWRLLFLVVCIAGGSLGGFRSFLLGSVIFLGVVFFLEGLHRTRYLALIVALGVTAFGVLSLCATRLPEGVQRAISFLPIQIEEHVKQDAQGSSEWRLRMWELLWAEVPNHLFLGKGFALDPQQMHFSGFNAGMGYGIQAEWAVLAGEYHNGPMSVLLPFGVWGVLAFVCFIWMAIARFRWHCRNGDPALSRINRTLFAMFLSKVIFFFLVIGSLYSDMVEFAVLIGLAESLNAEPQATYAREESPEAASLESLEREPL